MNRRSFFTFLSAAPLGLPSALASTPKTLTVEEAVRRQTAALDTVEKALRRHRYAVARNRGFLSVSEIRERENLNRVKLTPAPAQAEPIA